MRDHRLVGKRSMAGSHARKALPSECEAGNGNTSDRKSTRLNSSHGYISYAVFCLKKKNKRIVAAYVMVTSMDLPECVPSSSNSNSRVRTYQLNTYIRMSPNSLRVTCRFYPAITDT